MSTANTHSAPTRSLKDRGLVRLTFDVPVGDGNLLAALAQRTGYNKVTTILRAIRVLDDLEQATRNGGSVTITHPDGSKERLLIR